MVMSKMLEEISPQPTAPTPSAAAYKARAERVVQLYGGFEPVPGVPINGRLTLGENISDIGGIQIAFEGLQIALARQRAAGKEPPLIDGQTPETIWLLPSVFTVRPLLSPW